MIKYEKFQLSNGLEVLVHEDRETEMAVVNLLYKVGSRNEMAGKTGLAHFFEHLMFGGSKNATDFDSELERVGGECNAFTNSDITNYYITLPAINIETAFWLESDRMFQVNLSKRTIETQRKVVIEEFKQRYLNQPYGDAMHKLRELAYQRHPYQWPTIGKDISDIEGYQNEEILDFYNKHYSPNNAVLVVAGNVTVSQIEKLAQKWFSSIPAKDRAGLAPIPAELPQLEKRALTYFSDVPTDCIYKVFHVPGRLERGYLEADLITDILGFGRSSLLEQRLVKNSDVFASCSSYLLGSIDPGLMVFTGKMEKGKTAEEAEVLLDQVLEEFKSSDITSITLDKVKNQAEAMKTYESIQLLNRAMGLAYYTQLGDTDLYQTEFDKKTSISAEEILQTANDLLVETNASVLYYKNKNQNGV